jgi:hypothetical protein
MSTVRNYPFQLDCRFGLNLVFLAMSAMMVWLRRRGRNGGRGGHDHGGSTSLTDKVMHALSGAAILWLVAGLVAPRLISLTN